ncbi:MAG: hypothetical protein KBH29_01750 [Lutibacter sp.]|nr:hypothetical protein [Lutibacter sp.]
MITLLQTEMYHHDTDVDETLKMNTIKLVNWIDHLKYIKKELNNLISIYREDLSYKLYDENVLQKLQKKEIENNNLLNALRKYMSLREVIAECEDIQCDMIFIKEQEIYRRCYLYHLDKYRRLKVNFLNKV